MPEMSGMRSNTAKSVIICEPECKGYAHIDFNSEMIRILYTQSEKLAFIGEKKQCKALRKRLDDLLPIESMEFRSRRLTPLKINIFIRLFFDLNFVASIFSEARHYGNCRIVFLSCNETNLAAMKLLSWLNPIQEIDVIVHGILEQVGKGHPYYYRNPINWYKILFWFGYPLCMPASHKLRMFVLSPSIRSSLISLMPKLDRSIEYIYHPIPRVNDRGQKIARKNSNLKMCWIGIINDLKGGNTFNCIVRKSFAEGNSLEFNLLGYVNDPRFILDEHVRLYGPISDYLPPDTMDEIAPLMDYVILTYPQDSYFLTASGAFMTALGYGLPVLCLRNPFFESLFAKFGEIGIMVESSEQLTQLIISDQEGLRKRLPEFKHNVAVIRDEINKFNQWAFSVRKQIV